MAKLKRRYKTTTVLKYGASKCTRCDALDLCTKPLREYWKGITLTVSLCRACSKIVCKQFIDSLIEGLEHETELNKLTQHNQR